VEPPSAPTPHLGADTTAVTRRESVIGYRGSRLLGVRGVLVSTVSTVVVLIVLAVVIVSAPGSSVVRERFFSWSHIRDAFPQVLGGFAFNVRMFLVAEAFILVFALVLAVVRSLPGPWFFPLRAMVVGYVDLFRGIPLILLLYIIGFALPGLGLRGISTQSIFVYGVVSLVLVYSAYVAEVYRAGIESVHESQTAAARSLGLTRWQTLRYVVLPQAVRRVVPPLLNDFIGLQKDTALVATLGLVEALREAQAYGVEKFNYAGFVVAAVLFVLITIPLARFTDYLVARDRRRRQAGAGL
jgi:polar amino acid transport system permease protein